MNLKDYENFKRDVLKKAFLKYLQNATSKDEQEYLIKIIENINWYWHKTMFDYYEKLIMDLFDENSILIDYKDLSSSSSVAISTYLQNGIVAPNDVINIDKCKKLPSNINKIFLVDDFIGSGDTMISTLNKIKEKGWTNKQIYIISYICLNQGKMAIEQLLDIKNEILLKYKVMEKNYLEMGFNKQINNYINSICNRCKNEKFAFGYKNCGSMVSINGTSSNNNLSMLYRKDIKKWNNLLDRDVNLIVLEERRSKIIKENKNLISKYFYQNVINHNISLKEFELLTLLYNCYGIDIVLLKKYGYFATIKEYEETLKLLYNKKILKNDFFIEIIDKNMLQVLKKFNEFLENNFIKRKSLKFY